MNESALITNDAVLMGVLAIILGAVFYTSSSDKPYFKAFYKYVPALLLCYFLPSLLNTFGLIHGETSGVYFVASKFLLPACLVLLTLSIDIKKIIALGPKALILFLTGTFGVVIGGPIAILIVAMFSPETVGGHGPDAIWRGMTTIAGSWIGGGANQLAMKETFEVGDTLFSVMVTIDILVANLWMAILLIMAGKSKEIDARTGADTSAIDDLKATVEAFHKEHSRIPQLPDLMMLVAVAFGVTGLAHLGADTLAPWIGANAPGLADFSLDKKFFWIVVIATTCGLLLSFTRARQLEGVGASKVGSVFIYILVAAIGTKMDVTAILDQAELFGVGLIWMSIHAGLLFLVAKLINAPVFFLAVGSKANIGGAASAPVVAAAFHPSLAPVGVLLAVMGYALGTYAALLTGYLMRFAAPMT